MIQVLSKTAKILDLVSLHKSCSLKELTIMTGMKKPTLFVILKSLINIGYLDKDSESNYVLGKKLCELTNSVRMDDSLASIAREAAWELSQKVKEAANVGIFRNGKRYTIASFSYSQSVTVNDNLFKSTPVYNSATGMLLIAYLDEKDLDKIIHENGLPKDEKGQEMSLNNLKKLFAGIKKEKLFIKMTQDGQVAFISVPVFGKDGKICAALGVSAPSFRLDDAHKAEIIDNMQKVSKRITEALV
jgi:DNA-binding IclR family transcriptional regulator